MDHTMKIDELERRIEALEIQVKGLIATPDSGPQFLTPEMLGITRKGVKR